MAKKYRFRFKQMDVYQAAVQHFTWCVTAVGRMPRGPYVVTNQVLGASLSIMGNVGEANGRDKQPGEVEQHYRYAQGSTFESATHLDALAAMDVIDDDEYNRQEEMLARVAAMLAKLIQRQQKARRRLAAARRRQVSASRRDRRGQIPREGEGAGSNVEPSRSEVRSAPEEPGRIKSPPRGVTRPRERPT